MTPLRVSAQPITPAPSHPPGRAARSAGSSSSGESRGGGDGRVRWQRVHDGCGAGGFAPRQLAPVEDTKEP
jgi:hypothetical protein